MWSGGSSTASSGCGSNPAATSIEVLADVRELLGHRADREHLLEPGALLQQPDRSLDEQRVDDQRGDLGVVDDVRVVVERAQRVQRRTPVALRLARPEDEQHLGLVQREQRARGTLARVERLEGLDVLADPQRHLAPGERGVAEVHHRLVPVPLQRRHHQVSVVGAQPHLVGLNRHGGETRTCSSSGQCRRCVGEPRDVTIRPSDRPSSARRPAQLLRDCALRRCCCPPLAGQARDLGLGRPSLSVGERLRDRCRSAPRSTCPGRP